MIDNLIQSLRYAFRTLARSPGFTLTVVLTLALGIGANSTVFTMFNAVLLRQLPFPEADRLVAVQESRPNAPTSNTAPVRIEEWNERNTTFEAITGYYREDVSETSGDLPEKYRLAHVAPRFLEVWRMQPLMGRGFTAAESEVGATPVVLVSYRYWTTKLERDPNVLERTVRIGAESIPIIGVMPESFHFPDRDVDLYQPTIYADYVLGRRNLWYRGYGRLRPGVSVAQARADLNVIQQRLGEQYPDSDRELGVYVEQLKETTVGNVRGSLWLLYGAVTVLLLIASINIAALLLARVSRRRQEIAVRLALGASPWSISARILAETAVLTIAGAMLGLVLAGGGSAALRKLAPDFPRIEELSLDGGNLLYLLVAIVAITVLCGAVPAIHSVRAGVSSSLTDLRRTQVGTRHTLQWLFVGIQVTLSVMLLAGAGLLIRSAEELARVDPGFEPDRILSFRIGGTFIDFGQLAPHIPAILEELRALPGVEDAAMSSPVPGMQDDHSGFQFSAAELQIEGRDTTEESAIAQVRMVSSSYFTTMRIPLIAGALCREQPVDLPDMLPEGTTFDIMVNSIFATRYLGGRSAIGAIVRPNPSVAFRIAGVVGDAREFALSREPVPTYYQCRSAYATPALAFLVRSRGEPENIVNAVRTRLQELEPLRAVYDIAPLATRIGNEYAQDRLRTATLALFAGAALVLACLGIYGTLSYVVSLRQREVGLRVALGALTRNVVAQYLLKALQIVSVASAIGLALTFAISRLLSGMLYGVSPSDPLTLAGVVVMVLAVATCAALVPALRAARIDPMRALREE